MLLSRYRDILLVRALSSILLVNFYYFVLLQGGYEEVCHLLIGTFPDLLSPLLKLAQNQDYEESKVRCHFLAEAGVYSSLTYIVTETRFC